MLIRNSLLNILGLGIPLLAALVCIPVLVDGLGATKFGFLTIIWAVASYFSLFDLGLGRALTKAVSEKLTEAREGLGRVVWTALTLMAAISLLILVSVMIGAHFLFVPPAEFTNESEAVNAIYLMSLTIPFVVLTTGLRGILESFQSFVIINAIRIPMGLYTFVAPVAALYFQGDLSHIALLLLVGRVLAFFAHWHYAGKVCPELKKYERWYAVQAKELLVTGGWVSVSNIVGPLMGYVDRFIIGWVISLAAVAYYVTPYEMITKLWIVPGAVTAVLFPEFSRLVKSQGGVKSIFIKGISLIGISLFPICLVIFVFSYEGLSLWLGSEFADNSWVILRVFCVGIFINCIAHVPFTYLQACGSAGVAAKIHLSEAVVYIPALFFAATLFGLSGVVWVWLLRIVIDTGLMTVIATRRVGLYA